MPLQLTCDSTEYYYYYYIIRKENLNVNYLEIIIKLNFKINLYIVFMFWILTAFYT